MSLIAIKGSLRTSKRYKKLGCLGLATQPRLETEVIVGWLYPYGDLNFGDFQANP